LEQRRLLASYGLEVLAKTGDTTNQGDSITAISNTSINDLGQIAFLGNTAAGTAIFASGVVGLGIDRLTFAPSSTRVFASPRINNAGQVVASDRVSGSPIQSLIRTWDAHNPGSWNIIASTTHTNSSFTYDSVLLPTIADDQSVAFVGLTGGSVNTGLYLDNNNIPTSGETVMGSLSGGGFRPLNAEGGRVVVEDSPSAHDRILLYGSTPGLVANYPNFTDLGAAPGITGTGNLVSFYGDLSAAGAAALNASDPAGFAPLNPGPGIFVSLDAVGGVRPIVRIAGISGNGFLDPGETFTDINDNGKFDPGELDIGRFSGFVPDARVGIGFATGRQIQQYTLGFMATATSGVTNFYACGLNGNGAIPVISGTNVVAGIGGAIAGLSGTVTGITLADPVNDKGQLVFSVLMAGGQQAVIRADPPQRALDFSYDSTNAAGWQKIFGQGFTLAVADLWTGFNTFPNAQPQLEFAQQAGLSVAGYVALSFNQPSRTGKIQVDRALNSLDGLDSEERQPLSQIAKSLQFVAIDVEPDGQPVNVNAVTWISDAVSEVKQFGLTPIIYTSRNGWQTITGGSTAFASLALWDASPGSASKPAAPELDPFVPYPNASIGWTRRAMRQYDIGPNFDGAGEEVVTGFHVDVNVFDLHRLNTRPPLPADATEDGNVDFGDLVIVAQNYGATDKSWNQGDFDGDGNVSFVDLVLIAQNYGKSLPTSASSIPVALPSPSVSGQIRGLVPPASGRDTQATLRGPAHVAVPKPFLVFKVRKRITDAVWNS